MRQKLAALCLLIVCLAGMNSAFAQDSSMVRRHPKKESFWDRTFTGGNVGFQFGTVTFAEISPLLGYRFTDRIHGGVGATYQYYHYKDQYYDFKTDVYGGRVFGRYYFTDFLFGHGEYEYLNLEAFDFQRRRVDVGSLLGGVGYFQRFAEFSGLSAMLLYNFTESAYTPYTNPIFRIGIVIGL
jgi:hypothetical protein